MITDITMNSVACYKSLVKLSVEKKVTLLYGLNGSGKSTLSNFLYDPSNERHSACSITTTGATDILVYNQKFVEDFFYEDDSLKGVFTLSKENKDVKLNIKDKEKELNVQKEAQSFLTDEFRISESDNKQRRKGTVDKVWEIKTKYSGGDRVLEYCLSGLMRKEKLYQHLKTTQFEEDADSIDIDKLKEDASSLQSDDATVVELLSPIEFNYHQIEKNIKFTKAITGSADGPVADFIGTLGNSDWVKKGLSYTQNSETDDQYSICPFCQEETITDALLVSIRELFDGEYKEDLAEIKWLLDSYKKAVNELKLPPLIESKFATAEEVTLWKTGVSEFKLILQDNLKKIKNKIINPASLVLLCLTIDKVTDLNSMGAALMEQSKTVVNRGTQHCRHWF
ncbi:MAG: AAA family ATPase [Desulfobacterium sp.]|nr:AAA family ATPase [Desulfobacterium sp.]